MKYVYVHLIWSARFNRIRTNKVLLQCTGDSDGNNHFDISGYFVTSEFDTRELNVRIVVYTSP